MPAAQGQHTHSARTNLIIVTVVNIQGYDPVKNIRGPDWIVACMIPRGNMMASILKKVDNQNGFKLVNFNCSNKKETPTENKYLLNDFKAFLEQGISSLVRDGESYILEVRNANTPEM